MVTCIKEKRHKKLLKHCNRVQVRIQVICRVSTMSGRKMKAKSMPALGNYRCSSMCQTCTVCGWGVIMEKKKPRPNTNTQLECNWQPIHNLSAADLDSNINGGIDRPPVGGLVGSDSIHFYIINTANYIFREYYCINLPLKCFTINCFHPRGRKKYTHTQKLTSAHYWGNVCQNCSWVDIFAALSLAEVGKKC